MANKAKRLGALASLARDFVILAGMASVGWGAFLFHRGLGFICWGGGLILLGVLLVPPKP